MTPLVAEPETELSSQARKTPYLTVEERETAGKDARERTPRETLGMWAAPSNRADPVTILQDQAVNRLQELLPVRYGRMLASPFAFYRGAAAIMAHDLKESARSGFSVQLCGDAHLANFGFYASAERKLVFDINDFDETLPGPWEFDLKRLVTSFVIAAENLGLSNAHCEEIARVVASTYSEMMRRFSELGVLELWYEAVDEQFILKWAESQGKQRAKLVSTNIQKAKSNTSSKAVSKLTGVFDGEIRFIDSPTVQRVSGELKELAESELRKYRSTLRADRRALLEKYRIVDVALKVVGVGSVGTRALIVLLEGRDQSDPLVLQVKQAERSVLEAALPNSKHKNQGQRVVVGQHSLQTASDIFLGWVSASSGNDFYVRQFRDWKYSLDLETVSKKQLTHYAMFTAAILAKGHARIGDPVAIASYIGKNDDVADAMVEFGLAYADQNKKDYQALVDAVKSGRITATIGV